jgi:hypothetical protein
MSEETKPPRKEPVLQPMRVVNVDGPAPSLGMPVNLNIPDPKPGSKIPVEKKALVRSKKEIEAAQRSESKAKPNMGIPYVFPDANTNTTPGPDDSIRNAKSNRNIEQLPDYDEEWLESTGGEPVSRAWLQTAVSISGFIGSESSFTSQNINGLTMTWKNETLICQIKKTNGTKVFVVPSANVKIMEFR